jgi:signal transduction histidine kinase
MQGTITFVSAPGDVALTKEDVALAGGIAAHCAMALDNANLYQQAEVLRAAADAANRSKSTFLATMSHELRTPLNAIAGFAELIDLGLQGPVSEDQHRALGRIKANQTHLTALIGEILEFAQVDAGEAPHHEVAMSMAHAIQQVAQRFAETAAAKQLTLATDGSDRHAVAWADPQRVRQILVHLVMNAIEYTPASGQPITLVSRASGDSVRTYVTDYGPGIPADRFTAIFEPFVQLNDGLPDRRDGVGLGLAISRSLARAMNGDLTVESTVGLGSRFILTLPRATSARTVGGGAKAVAGLADARTASRAFRDDRTHGGVRLRDVERVVIERTMEATGGNQTVSARMLGISRPTLLRKLKSYGHATATPGSSEPRDVS